MKIAEKEGKTDLAAGYVTVLAPPSAIGCVDVLVDLCTNLD